MKTYIHVHIETKDAFIAPPAPYGSKPSTNSYIGKILVSTSKLGVGANYNEIIAKLRQLGIPKDIEVNSGDGYKTAIILSKTVSQTELTNLLGRFQA
jgi:hypothetical protein